MGRAPCCEKTGLKKGPWTPEEDRILISYIHQHGHTNWRALPKLAGLLRCGKSCRLRWTNYLRPDIKRGNFSREEEDNIIQLHELLGNRWSAIAAKLPGRTDNEIKNVWHTHLKKRLNNRQKSCDSNTLTNEPKSENSTNFPTQQEISSPQQSSSELSTVTESTTVPIKDEQMDISQTFPEIDESFWSEELSTSQSEIWGPTTYDINLDTDPSSPIRSGGMINGYDYLNSDDGLDFWYNLFIRTEGLPELPEF